MPASTLTWITETTDGILRIVFAGRQQPGAHGNQDGELMRKVIQDALLEAKPARLVIDVSRVEYQAGDWLAWGPLAALKALGRGRVCLIASGESARAIHALWQLSRLNQLVPIFQEHSEAVRHLESLGLANSPRHS